jgi:fluoride ion exporter CrcB/FEX
VCGALTTFSTVQLELYKMVRAHEWALGVGYAAGTILASFAAVTVGTALVRRVRTIL